MQAKRSHTPLPCLILRTFGQQGTEPRTLSSLWTSDRSKSPLCLCLGATRVCNRLGNEMHCMCLESLFMQHGLSILWKAFGNGKCEKWGHCLLRHWAAAPQTGLAWPGPLSLSLPPAQQGTTQGFKGIGGHRVGAAVGEQGMAGAAKLHRKRWGCCCNWSGMLPLLPV